MAHHDHHSSAGHNSSSGRALTTALAVAVMVMVLEFAGAYVFNALALAADGAHMLSDVAALVIAVIAQRVAARPRSATHSYGWVRAEVLAAEVNAFLLLLAALVVAVEAVRRYGSAGSINAAGLIGVAAISLVANLTNSVILLRSNRGGHNLNVKAASIHALGDAAGAAAAIIAGVVIALGGDTLSDSVAAAVIAVLIVVAAIRLLRETLHVLLEATPSHLSADEVKSTLEADAAVLTVHDLHVWTLAPGSVALSAHVELDGEVTLHQAQAEGARLKALLAERFQVDHSTLELECHACADDSAY
jgi:cobalt-zinc-cadmium efflux system protein